MVSSSCFPLPRFPWSRPLSCARSAPWAASLWRHCSLSPPFPSRRRWKWRHFRPPPAGSAEAPCPHRWAPTPTTGRTGRMRWAGAVAKGRDSRGEKAWAGGALLFRGSVWGGKAARRRECGEAAPGLGPSLGTRCLVWWPAVFRGDRALSWGSAPFREAPPRGIEPPGRALPQFPGPHSAKGTSCPAAPAPCRGSGAERGPSVPVAASLRAEASPQWAQCRQSLLRDNGGDVTCCSPGSDSFRSQEYTFYLVILSFTPNYNSYQIIIL